MRDRDNQGNGNGGQGFPFGGFGGTGMPILIQQREQPVQQRPNEPVEPPLRVQVALTMMRMMTQKTASQAAANDHNIEIIPGQKLTPHEEGAYDTAMELMSHYLGQDLQPDQWEQQNLNNYAQTNGVPTVSFKCMCTRSDTALANPDCIFCGGEGTMDIVCRNPHRAFVDPNGNVSVLGTSNRTKNMSSVMEPPPPGPNKVPRPPRGKGARPDTTPEE